MKLRIRDLVKATRGQLLSGYPNDLCGRPSIDTRTLRPGDAFFALKGPRFDGHDFSQAAARKGAGSLVVHALDERLRFDPARPPDVIWVRDTLGALQDAARYARSESHAVVIGITGSNGKTTTKEMLYAILGRAGKTLATRGNLNNHIGLPLTLCELGPEHRYAVLEMGTSKKGDMELLVEVARPQVGLITNVGKDHLEFFGSPEGVLAANRGLFDRLPKEGIAVLNVDDPLLKGLEGQLACRTLTYGSSPAAAVQIINIQPWPPPLRFKLVLGKEIYPVSLNVLGTVQALNAVAAAAVAHALDIRADDIVQGLQAFKPVAMRLETHARPDGSVLVNDAYNANPSSVRASVESFCAAHPDRPRWLVLGDMRELGDQSRREHEALGQWLATLPIDRILLYGREARYIGQAASAAGFGGSVERFPKKRYLIDALKRALPDSRSAVLFKASRRLGLEQVVNTLL